MTQTYPLDHPHGLPLDEVKALVGGKAANLGVMLGPELGLPVPPGFAITTAACRAYLADGWPDGLDGELRDRMAGVERAVGRRFGDASDPLLVSVRSGAPVSMPGMMDTILNLGLNDETAHGLATGSGDEAFARDCHARFRAMFREIVGAEPPDDPWRQLRLAIEAVFRSWNSPRAVTYRQREGIPDDVGTAVTVQAMVFGNLGEGSATGVIFTRNPATGEPELYGDVLFDAQGEDVVAGTHETLPIASLGERMPDVATSLREYADRLERHYRDLCDIEFTIERGRLWMLQTRVGKRSPQAALRIAVDMAEDPSFPLTPGEAVERVRDLLADPPRLSTGRRDGALPLARGLGASPGVASGEIVTTAEAAQRAAEAGRTVLLVRPETSPDDVHGMARAAGILTARGGLASHAAVVARGWGIPAVVGAAEVEVRDGAVVIGSRTLGEGDTITIDGATGEVFEGAVAGASEIVPEARTLLEWAKDAGIEIGADGGGADAAQAEEAGTPDAAGSGAVSADDCVRRLSTKGFTTTAALAEAFMCPPESVQPVVNELVASGAVGTVAGSYRLQAAGAARADELLDEDRSRLGAEVASAAIEDFHALDQRMKEIVTAWQLRPSDGEPVLNDHTDAAYDRDVLDRLGVLHGDASAFLEPLERACGRLRGYRDRLTRALERARGGDQKYVASPRVDSYHGAWFELHEDLIRLAGRTREEEAAAGRA
jgi:pyruvate,orthophosphate dikinase